MLLERHDAALFIRLYSTFMIFVNQRLSVIPARFATLQEFFTLPLQDRIKIRNAWVANVDVLESFISENPARLSDSELDVVRSWRDFVAGKFYIFRDLKKHSVLMSATEPSTAYGVVALTQAFSELVGPTRPIMIETVLLPFQGKIVYDGFMIVYRVAFGAGIRGSLTESFNAAKLRHGVVVALPASPERLPRPIPKAKRISHMPTNSVIDETLGEILKLTDQFCQSHLNDELAEVCRNLAEKLARKRPSPLSRGGANVWACGIVRTIAVVNGLYVKSETPSVTASEIDSHFGTGSSTGEAKARSIRKLLKIRPFDADWTAPSRLGKNAFARLQHDPKFVNELRAAMRVAMRTARDAHPR